MLSIDDFPILSKGGKRKTLKINLGCKNPFTNLQLVNINYTPARCGGQIIIKLGEGEMIFKWFMTPFEVDGTHGRV